MTTVRDIYDFLDHWAPFAMQEDWDNSGLILGSFGQRVRRAAVCLDVPAGPLEADLVISHHPVIFRARKTFTNPLDPAEYLLRRGASAIAFHTNYDVCPGGVNDILAARLGLKEIETLPNGVRIGTTQPASLEEFARFVSQALGCPAVRYRKAGGETLTRVAVCGGSGCSFLGELFGKADAFITGDADYHDFLEAAWHGLGLVAAGHYHTEIIAVPPLLERLREAFPAVAWELLDCGAEQYII